MKNKLYFVYINMRSSPQISTDLSTIAAAFRNAGCIVTLVDACCFAGHNRHNPLRLSTNI